MKKEQKDVRLLTVTELFSLIMKFKKQYDKVAETARSTDEDQTNFNRVMEIGETIKELLVELLRREFTTLSKAKLLIVCDLVSALRPVQPFSFLVSISNRKK